MSNYLPPSLHPLKYLRQIPLIPVTFGYWNLVWANVNSHLICDWKPSALPEWPGLAAGGAWPEGAESLEFFFPTPCPLPPGAHLPDRCCWRHPHPKGGHPGLGLSTFLMSFWPMGKPDILPSPGRDLAPRASFQPCLFLSIYLPRDTNRHRQIAVLLLKQMSGQRMWYWQFPEHTPSISPLTQRREEACYPCPREVYSHQELCSPSSWLWGSPPSPRAQPFPHRPKTRVDGIGASSATSIAENWLGALFRNRVSLRPFVSPVSLSSHSKTTERSHSTSNFRQNYNCETHDEGKEESTMRGGLPRWC